jgi:hypothetical protein
MLFRPQCSRSTTGMRLLDSRPMALLLRCIGPGARRRRSVSSWMPHQGDWTKSSMCSQNLLLRQSELNGGDWLQGAYPRFSGSAVITNSTLIANPLPRPCGVYYGAIPPLSTRSSSEATCDVMKFIRLMTASLSSTFHVSSSRHWFS